MRIIKKVIIRLYTILCKLKGAKIGLRSSIYYNSEISQIRNLQMGNDSILYKRNTIYLAKKGKWHIGNHSHVAPFGYFLIDANSIRIGNDVAIGPFCSFFCVSNSAKGESKLFRENYTAGDINIGNNIFIGAQCVILPGTSINDNVVIAANSVVSGILESGYLYGGSPSQKIKKLEH